MTTLTELKEEVDTVKQDLQEIRRNTAELLEAWKAAKSALRIMAFLGNMAKWITSIAGAMGLFYLWIKKG